MHKVAAALVVLAALVAGCSGAQPEGPAEGVPLGEDGEPLPLLALPTWALHDWWTYGIEVGAGEESTNTYVITGEAGGDWLMGTDSADRAFQDARDDISRLGPQRKSDLAGSQGDDRVQFFQWPLQAGANWTTRWDGQDVRIDVASVTPESATLTATNATRLMYTYTYDAAARWFGRLDRHGPDGAVAFSLVLVTNGSAWTGTAMAWELAALAAGDMAPGTPVNGGLNGFPGLPVAAGTTDLWFSYNIPCDSRGGGYTIVLRPQDPASGQSYQASSQCNGDVSFAGIAVEQPVAGDWALAISFGSAPTPNGLTFELLGRTLVETPIGG